jgi:hypothetical protein
MTSVFGLCFIQQNGFVAKRQIILLVGNEQDHLALPGQPEAVIEQLPFGPFVQLAERLIQYQHIGIFV